MKVPPAQRLREHPIRAVHRATSAHRQEATHRPAVRSHPAGHPVLRSTARQAHHSAARREASPAATAVVAATLPVAVTVAADNVQRQFINTLEYKKVVFSRTKEDKYTEKNLGLELES